MRLRLPCLALSLFAISHAHAEALEVNDYAQRFPLQVEAQHGLFAIDLTPAVYAQLTRADLGDLAVIDAAGNALPIQRQRAMDLPPEQRVEDREAQLFLVNNGVREAGGLRLQLEQADTKGKGVQQLTLEASGSVTKEVNNEWLIDAGEQPDYDSLRVAPVNTAALRLKVSVLGSNDLDTWQSLRNEETLLSLAQGDGSVARLRIPVGEYDFRYLSVRSVDGSTLPHLQSVFVGKARWEGGSRQHDVIARPATPVEGGWTVDVGGLLPIDEIQLQSNTAFTTVVSVDALQRDTPGTPGDAWQFVAAATQFQLPDASDGSWLRSDPMPVPVTRTSTLRLRADGMADAPKVMLGYRPDRLVVLAQGTGPYSLLAGSGTTTQQDANIDTAIAAVQSGRGTDWQPPLAEIGNAEETGGEAAKSATPRPDGGTVALWALLGLGVLVVAAAAWRVLKTPAA